MHVVLSGAAPLPIPELTNPEDVGMVAATQPQLPPFRAEAGAASSSADTQRGRAGSTRPQTDVMFVETGKPYSDPSAVGPCVLSLAAAAASASADATLPAALPTARLVFSVSGVPFELVVGTSPAALTDIMATFSDYVTFFAGDARFPPLNEEALRGELAHTFSEFDRAQAEARAIADAADFVVPLTMLERDTQAVLACDSVSSVVEALPLFARACLPAWLPVTHGG